jgi:hypothetical protein
MGSCMQMHKITLKADIPGQPAPFALMPESGTAIPTGSAPVVDQVAGKMGS